MALLEASWGFLGVSWGPLGDLLGSLGASWGPLGGLLGTFWGLLGRLGRLLGTFWAEKDMLFLRGSEITSAARLCVRVHVHVHAHVHVCACMYMRMCVCVRVRACACACVRSPRTRTRTHTRTARACACACVCACMRVCVCVWPPQELNTSGGRRSVRAARPPLVTYFVSSTKSSSLDDSFWKKVSTGGSQHALLACGRGRRIDRALRATTAATLLGSTFVKVLSVFVSDRCE